MEYAMEFGDPVADLRVQTKQELKISECVAVYNAQDMNKVERIVEHDQEHREWKAYHSIASKYHSSLSKASFSNDIHLS